MIRADQDRNFTFRARSTSAGKYITLADETMKDLDVAPDGKWGVAGTSARTSPTTRASGRGLLPGELATGERTLIAKGQPTGRHVFGISPHGTHFLFWKDGKDQAYDFNANATRALGGGRAELRRHGIRPPGHEAVLRRRRLRERRQGVIANHRYDLWLLPLDGAPKNLTNGSGRKTRRSASRRRPRI